jgi:protein KTI12
MALVTISGFPCSGKSTRALQLKEDFQARLFAPGYTGPQLSVIIVDDESNHVDRSVYDSKPRLPPETTSRQMGQLITQTAYPRSLVGPISTLR